VPGGDDAAAELWVVRRAIVAGLPSGAPVVSRYAAGTWTTITFPDTPSTTATGTDWSFATFNSKLFIAYDSAINRLHVWDGVSVRRVGEAPPAAAPGLASIGAGALSFTRFYRVRFRATIGNTIILSEPGPSASITVAASSGVRVTRPALVDGNEQAWHIEYADSANGPWFEFAQIAIGTLTFDDTSATINVNFPPSAELGTYTLPPSAKYLSVYQNQILMAGAWETSSIAGQSEPRNNRVWFTRPLHTFDLGDDESIPTTTDFKFWADLGEDNDRINGLSYPLEGIPYALKMRQVWALIPTDDATVPFRVARLTDAVGCRDYRTICIGEDESGNPALYWNSIRGPYRMGRVGIQFLGRDISTVGFAIATRAVWVADLRQVWFVEAGTAQYWKFNVRYGASQRSDVRNGWTRDVVSFFNVWSLAVFSEGFTLTNPQLQPLLGTQRGAQAPFASEILRRDPAAQTDDGTTYAVTMSTGAYTIGQLLYNTVIYPPRMYASPDPPGAAPTSVDLQLTLWKNLVGQSSPLGITDTETFTTGAGGVGGQHEYIRTFEGLQWSDGETVQIAVVRALTTPTIGVRAFALVLPYQLAQEAE
jgi:hypothetical protein